MSRYEEIKIRRQKLNELKQKYLYLKECILSYREIENDKSSNEFEKENIKVKKLVLTKPFYGKNLVVG